MNDLRNGGPRATRFHDFEEAEGVVIRPTSDEPNPSQAARDLRGRSEGDNVVPDN